MRFLAALAAFGALGAFGVAPGREPAAGAARAQRDRQPPADALGRVRASACSAGSGSTRSADRSEAERWIAGRDRGWSSVASCWRSAAGLVVARGPTLRGEGPRALRGRGDRRRRGPTLASIATGPSGRPARPRPFLPRYYLLLAAAPCSALLRRRSAAWRRCGGRAGPGAIAGRPVLSLARRGRPVRVRLRPEPGDRRRGRPPRVRP